MELTKIEERANRAKEIYQKNLIQQEVDKQLVKIYDYFETRMDAIEDKLKLIKQEVVSKDDYKEITFGANTGRKYEPNVEYISTITYMKYIGNFNFDNKTFSKFIIQLDNCKDYFEIVRNIELKPLSIGVILKHQIKEANVRPYKVISIN